MFLGNVVSVAFGERCRFTHGTSMSIFANRLYLETLSINSENLDSSLLTQDSIPKIKGNGYSFSFDKPLL